MTSRNHRRAFLSQALQVAAVGCLPGLPVVARAARRATATPLAIQRLTPQVSVVTGAGCNVTLLDSADGLLMVDGGLSANAPKLLDFIATTMGRRPVQLLFNTHWHAQNTGANLALGKAGRKIVAHENTRLWLGTDVDLKWEGTQHKPLPAAALPNETFYTTGQKDFGGESVRYGVLTQAHTDGDLYVHLPEQNVLVAGDVVSVGSYPVLDYCTGGWIIGMLLGSRALLQMTDANTRVIPGNGPVVGRAHLEAQVAMLAEMSTRLVDLLRKGLSAEDMLAVKPSQPFDAQWGDPELFITNAYPGLWGHVRDLPNYGYSGVV